MERKEFTWDDIYERAIDTACGDYRLKAKDTARYPRHTGMASLSPLKNSFSFSIIVLVSKAKSINPIH